MVTKKDRLIEENGKTLQNQKKLNVAEGFMKTLRKN